MHLTDVFDRVLRNGDTVLDIGAHAGDVAAHIAKCIQPGIVHSFEPHPEKFAALQARAATLPNLIALNYAVSETAHPVTLYYGVIPSADQASTICTDLANPARLGNDIRSLEVAATTVDAYCQARDIRPDIIKIDVEGAETLVVDGAARTLQAQPLLIVELGVENSLPRYLDKLRKIGYVLALTDITIFTTKPPSWDHILTSHTESLNDCILSFSDEDALRLAPFLGNLIAAIPGRHDRRLAPFRQLPLTETADKLAAPRP